MARGLSGGRRLLLRARHCLVNAGPRWRARCPDGHRRLRKLRIVEGSSANEYQVRSGLRFAKQWRATARAEAAEHPVSAVRQARIVARRACNLEGRRVKARSDRAAACAQVLAIPAPAHPNGNWRLEALPKNFAAKATACQSHVTLQGRRCTASRNLFSGVFRTVSPNPSIERTSQRPLRALCAAAHVERWAPAK